MRIPFKKYQGTGNDFILIDNRMNSWQDKLTTEQIKQMCHRRFGIGADGVMLLGDSRSADFSMLYYNSDGNKSSMCGNGGRCIVHFAHSLNVFTRETTFEFDNDIYHAEYHIDEGLVSLKMQDVLSIDHLEKNTFFLNTGSPHYVRFTDSLYTREEVVTQGRMIRNSERFKKEGTNVNFCVPNKPFIHVNTYERGVEDFTYSCGTGVVACSLAYSSLLRKEGRIQQNIRTEGGNLSVEFSALNNQFTDIFLKGPAVCVFEGEIEI